MQNKKQIQKLCKDGNTGQARATLLTMLDNDRFRKNMLASEIMNSSELKDLFEEDNHLLLKKEGWNYEYWTTMNIELSNNFSKEKLKHLIDVMEALRKEKHVNFTPTTSTKDKSPRKPAKRIEESQNKSSYFDRAIKDKAIKLIEPTLRNIKNVKKIFHDR